MEAQCRDKEDGMKSIKIGQREIGKEFAPYIIAELSGNHNRSLEKALQLIDAAKEAGADAVKLQTYTPDTITLNQRSDEFFIKDGSSLWKDRNLYDLYKEAHTPWEWHEPLFNHARSIGIDIFSTPFDESAVDFLEKFQPSCYKIASLEIVDHDLIKKAASTGKPLLISTGGATLVEIGEAVEAAKSAGCSDIVLLKCTAAYPADPKDANLRTIPHLAGCFSTLVGLSDHTLGIGVAVASIALGASVIEKHFTISRAEGGVDSAFSLEPQEMKALVIESKRAWESLGAIRYQKLEKEQSIFSLRPSLYFVENLKAGTVLKPEHVRSVRPGKGLPPKELEHIMGLLLTHDVSYGKAVAWEDFKR